MSGLGDVKKKAPEDAGANSELAVEHGSFVISALANGIAGLATVWAFMMAITLYIVGLKLSLSEWVVALGMVAAPYLLAWLLHLLSKYWFGDRVVALPED